MILKRKVFDVINYLFSTESKMKGDKINMKTIGLIGGMSWESTTEYYKIINQEIKKQLGGLHSAKCILYSVDFHEIEKLQSLGEWVKAGEILGGIAKSLEKAGANFIVICTNTMHKVVEDVQLNIGIPILHISDATAKAIKHTNIHTVGLLGTKYTMEQDFYKSRLESQGINVVVPNSEDRDIINKIIFNELCLGNPKEKSREYFKNIIQDLVYTRAEGIILGCTEIGLLIKPKDSTVPLFDTTYIHAEEATKIALEEND